MSIALGQERVDDAGIDGADMQRRCLDEQDFFIADDAGLFVIEMLMELEQLADIGEIPLESLGEGRKKPVDGSVVAHDAISKRKKCDGPAVVFFQDEVAAAFEPAEGEKGAAFAVGSAEHPHEIIGVADSAAIVGGKELADIRADVDEIEHGDGEMADGMEIDFDEGVSFGSI